MLFMVLERVKSKAPEFVGQRFREPGGGRLMPDTIRDTASWTIADRLPCS